MSDSVRADVPAPPDPDATPFSCPHMISLAEKRGVRRHPVSKQFFVKECARKSCRNLIPVEAMRCCYCGGEFKDMDHTIRIEAGVCRYFCRECRKHTEGCSTVHCIHCHGTNIVLVDPVLKRADP